MQTELIASTHLGKKSEGSVNYNPSLLVAVPREENRKQYSINSDDLFFKGYDIWHAYEFSCLTENGVPVTRLIKLRYNCDNKYIIESKSLKLYLNSFNMSRFGKNIQECLDICKNLIEKDLSEKLETDVKLNFLENKTPKIEVFKNFENVMNIIDESKLEINDFKEAPHLLEITENEAEKEYRITFDSLRSNCRVTHQPDFADIYIYYKSKKHIKEDSLIKYLTSFRSEYHFHEECCEMIFKRLSDILDRNDELFICCLYTRRGGIDIWPSRWSKNCNIEEIHILNDITTYTRCGIKQ